MAFFHRLRAYVILKLRLYTRIAPSRECGQRWNMGKRHPISPHRMGAAFKEGAHSRFCDRLERSRSECCPHSRHAPSSALKGADILSFYTFPVVFSGQLRRRPSGRRLPQRIMRQTTSRRKTRVESRSHHQPSAMSSIGGDLSSDVTTVIIISGNMGNIWSEGGGACFLLHLCVITNLL